MKVSIMRTDKSLPLPKYVREGDAGLDIYSSIDCTIKPGERVIIPSGIKIAVPEGHVGLVWDRGGMGIKNVIKTLGGVLDSNFRGELQIGLVNLSQQEHLIQKGDRIAQLLIQPVVQAKLEEVDDLPIDTVRGESWGGSSGYR
jgi:dUTP pyrophosphatase